MDNEDLTCLLKSNLNFGERLTEALYSKGYFGELEQVKGLADFCGVTEKTAKKYLKAENFPFGSRGLNLIKLASYLECSCNWLCNGDGLSPDMEKYINVLNTLPQNIKKGVIRQSIRLLNNDPKVKRFTYLRDSGLISYFQFYKMM